jgi:hypothetical protein
MPGVWRSFFMPCAADQVAGARDARVGEAPPLARPQAREQASELRGLHARPIRCVGHECGPEEGGSHPDLL